MLQFQQAESRRGTSSIHRHIVQPCRMMPRNCVSPGAHARLPGAGLPKPMHPIQLRIILMPAVFVQATTHDVF